MSQDEALVATKDASHKPNKCPRPVQKKILKVWKQRAALSRQKPGEGNGTGQKCSNAEGASNIEARKRGKKMLAVGALGPPCSCNNFLTVLMAF